MKNLYKFFLLSTADKYLVIKLLGYIIRSEILLGLIPYPLIKKFIFVNKDIKMNCTINQIDILRHHLSLILSVSHNLLWKPTCVRLAIALRDSLATVGIESSIKIGVSRYKEKLVAHAWVECSGMEVLKNGVYNVLTPIRKD